MAQTHPNVSGHDRFEYVAVKGRAGFTLTLPEHRIWYNGEVDRFSAAKASQPQFYQRAQAWARSVTAADNIHTYTLPNGILVLKASVTDPFSYQNNLGTRSTHMTYNVTIWMLDHSCWYAASDFQLVNRKMPAGAAGKYQPLEAYLVPSQSKDKDPELVKSVFNSFYEGLDFLNVLLNDLSIPVQ